MLSKYLKIIFSSFLPDEHHASILNVDFELLKEQGFNCVLIDIDNTLLERKYSFPEWKIKKLTEELKNRNWTIILVSNNRRLNRTLKVADFLEVPCVYKALKPFPWVYKKIFRDFNCSSQKTICIGDQLCMDVLGGNLASCYTIYVDPLGPEQNLFRAIYIWLERLFLSLLEKID